MKKILNKLPSLYFSVGLTFFSLYAVLTFVIIIGVEFYDFNLMLSILSVIGILILQFILSPFLITLSLNFFYKVKWIELSDLPPHLKDFVIFVCKAQNINRPKFGIIEDGNPTAFCYGYGPNTAKILISSGIIEILDKEELENIVAHEIGHAVHWDMLLMTVIQAVPIALYGIYNIFIEKSKKLSTKKNNNNISIINFIALFAYFFSIVSQYLALFFSRVREYHADRFAANITGKPEKLANALVKIGYGLFERTVTAGDEKSNNTKLNPINTMNVFSGIHATNMPPMKLKYSLEEEIYLEKIAKAMRWDLFNVWAKYFELYSTHPLLAKRILYLSNQAQFMGKTPFIDLDKIEGKSNWSVFLFEFILKISLPFLSLSMLLIVFFKLGHFITNFFALNLNSFFQDEIILKSLHSIIEKSLNLPFIPMGCAILISIGILSILLYQKRYLDGPFKETTVDELLGITDVSIITGKTCKLKGKIIGKGIAGYIFSKDFIFEDNTGIMYLDIVQPFKILEFLFVIFKAEKFQGKEVLVEGWYHRGLKPYVEIKSIQSNDKTIKNYNPIFLLIQSSTPIILGISGMFFWIIF